MIISKNFSCPKVEEPVFQPYNELRRNGFKPAVIETNEERSYFLIGIPCRKGFGDRVLIVDDFSSADDDKINDKINDKIKSVLLKISGLGISKKKDCMM